MPVFDPREKNFPFLPFIILSNIFPLIGVMYYNMSFFMLFYLFWWETVIISFFQWLKMGKASLLADPDHSFTINGKTLTHQQVNSKKYMRRMFFVVRTFMLLFYLIFIVVFVGFFIPAQNNDEEGMLTTVQAIVFDDTWMRISFLVFIFVHGVDYINYLAAKQYEETSLRQLGMPFDGRIITMHIVIVGGTFLSMFVSEKLFANNAKAGQISIAALFVLIKILVDVASLKMQQRRTETISKALDSMKGKQK